MQLTSEFKVKYEDHMGTDLTVVNSARVSFDKRSKYETRLLCDTKDMYVSRPCREDCCDWERCLAHRDERLIKYLAEHNHFTPFSHPQITLSLSTPIPIARQLFKHKVGFTENEVSRRYVDSLPSFYMPKTWRAKADDRKQGSSDTETVEGIDDDVLKAYQVCLDTYDHLIRKGVCAEQARLVLPQAMMTEWFWTGSLIGFARVYNLRGQSDAQAETREVARAISAIIEPLFPISWKYLCQIKEDE